MVFTRLDGDVLLSYSHLVAYARFPSRRFSMSAMLSALIWTTCIGLASYDPTWIPKSKRAWLDTMNATIALCSCGSRKAWDKTSVVVEAAIEARNTKRDEDIERNTITAFCNRTTQAQWKSSQVITIPTS